MALFSCPFDNEGVQGVLWEIALARQEVSTEFLPPFNLIELTDVTVPAVRKRVLGEIVSKPAFDIGDKCSPPFTSGQKSFALSSPEYLQAELPDPATSPDGR